MKSNAPLKNITDAGLSSLGVPGVPWHTQILADQLTLFHPGGTDFAHLITTGTPRFSDLPTALRCTGKSLSEAVIFASTNPQYDDRLIVH